MLTANNKITEAQQRLQKAFQSLHPDSPAALYIGDAVALLSEAKLENNRIMEYYKTLAHSRPVGECLS